MTFGELMSFKQVSKFLYEDISYKSTKEPQKYIFQLYKDNWDHALCEFEKSYLRAFIHKSFGNENSIELGNNERLEFLGDSVLQLAISENLMLENTSSKEGELSKMRSILVNEASLAALARSLDLGRWILLGKGELKESGHQKDSILSNTFEALLGAIFLEHDYLAAKQFLMKSIKHFETKKKISFYEYAKKENMDVKSILQEKVMKQYKTTPVYRSKTETKDGKEYFEVELIIDGKSFGKEAKNSKKKAINTLAKKALENHFL